MPIANSYIDFFKVTNTTNNTIGLGDLVNVTIPAGKTIDLLKKPRVTKEKINQSQHLQIALKNGWLKITKPNKKSKKKRERQATVSDENYEDSIHLADLIDVDISVASEDDTIRYENGKWVNVPTTEIISKIVTVTATSYTLDTDTDDVLLVDVTSTIHLPTAVGIKGYQFTIKNIKDGATVTMDANGTETIDEELTKVITVQYTSVTLASDGSNWWVL